MPKLQPCPFPLCKGAAHLKKRKTVIIECNTCGVMVIRRTVEDAISAWHDNRLDEEDLKVLNGIQT